MEDGNDDGEVDVDANVETERIWAFVVVMRVYDKMWNGLETVVPVLRLSLFRCKLCSSPKAYTCHVAFCVRMKCEVCLVQISENRTPSAALYVVLCPRAAPCGAFFPMD